MKPLEKEISNVLLDLIYRKWAEEIEFEFFDKFDAATTWEPIQERLQRDYGIR